MTHSSSPEDLHTIDRAALRGVTGAGKAQLFVKAVEGTRKLLNAGIVAAHTWFPGHHLDEIRRIPEPKRIVRPVPDRPGKMVSGPPKD
jgi:hypothetical protein